MEIIYGVIVLAITWFVIFKILDGVEGLPWFERRRIQKAYETAKNWPPKRPLENTPATYRVIYSDGKSQDNRFLPNEIERWVAECNSGKFPYRVNQILDAKGNVVWPRR